MVELNFQIKGQLKMIHAQHISKLSIKITLALAYSPFFLQKVLIFNLILCIAWVIFPFFSEKKRKNVIIILCMVDIVCLALFSVCIRSIAKGYSSVQQFRIDIEKSVGIQFHCNGSLYKHFILGTKYLTFYVIYCILLSKSSFVC